MEAAVQPRKAAAEVDASAWPLVLRLKPVIELSEDQFFELCQINGEIWIERNADGELLLMSPVGEETGDRESEINMQLRVWAKRDGTGRAYGSAAGYRLPNGAVRAPDASWMVHARLEQFTTEQRKKFIPACPDFVIELRSPSDRLAVVQAKMAEYVANGARLGWLLDPDPRHVYVYRPDAPVERLDGLDEISGGPVLPDFVLDLREIW